MDSRKSPAEDHVIIPVGTVLLAGDLTLPPRARGLVLFAHGSGSSRHSPRNRYVASVLQKAGVGTLLFDLLTADEEAEDALTGHLRFDIDLLSNRLVGATDWALDLDDERLRGLGIGYFGASTGAAAALFAASARPGVVKAVVSRGGRPDLAASVLGQVRAPTLLIVGGDDSPVLEWNEEARDMLNCHRALAVIPGATHLFEEPGTLEEVARLAADWFSRHLAEAERAEVRRAS